MNGPFGNMNYKHLADQLETCFQSMTLRKQHKGMILKPQSHTSLTMNDMLDYNVGDNMNTHLAYTDSKSSGS